MTGCPDRRGDLAAHLLNVLEPEETSEVQQHLRGCDGCAAELSELAGLPSLLALVPAERAGTGTDEPDVGFADRLVAVAARRQRLHRRRWLAGVAAGLIILGAAGALAVGLARAPAGGRSHAVATATGISARVTLQPKASGTAITVRISGVPGREECVLLAVARDGRHDIAGSWRASYTGTASVQGSTAIPESELARLLVDTSDGRQLIAIPLGR